MKPVAAGATADPNRLLRDIAAQLDPMGKPPSRRGLSWQQSSAYTLLHEVRRFGRVQVLSNAQHHII